MDEETLEEIPTKAPEQVLQRNIEEEMKNSYLRYSMSVIISRALPDVRDGLKPSQRRILYAMKGLNLGPQSKHRKCAKISGDTSGDYHPHGEQVIYPTLVRMGQDWIMRYRLVDGQGNFGSVDGDPPAAMRYTEARLTHASMQMMEDLEKETVDMVPNYDETKKEPTVFPSKFPNLLCNGSSGIAVGMATNIPPHNMQELVLATKLVIDNPDVSIEEIMGVMPAPDFPTGGLICGYRGVKEGFYTGRGKIILRACVEVEEFGKDRQRIVVAELPYGVNKSRLIEHIADLVNQKTLSDISDLRDESDQRGMRIVCELKRSAIPQVVINQLYRFTDLQTTFGMNMLALHNGQPRTMNIRQLIAAWVEHRIEVIRRRTRFELAKAQARAHVLEGYLKAIDNLDEVVKLIRASQDRDEAKKELIARFEFTERQAMAVLDLRLYQLTGLERGKIEEEYNKLLLLIEELKELLASEGKVRTVIKEELDAIADKHKAPRATQIVPAEGDMDVEDLIPNVPVIITLSQDDYIKRMPIDTFREQKRGGSGVAGMQMKREDDVLKELYVAKSHDYLLLFTNFGRCYWLKAWQVPDAGRRSKGRPLVNFLEDIRPDERVEAVVHADELNDLSSVILCTRNGIVKKTSLESFSRPRKKGIWALQIDEGDELISARLVKPGMQVMLFTRNGMAVRFDESDVRNMGRMARGVKGATLRNGDDRIIGMEVVNGEETLLIVCEKGYGKRSPVEDFRQTKRGGVGVRSIVTSERNGPVVGALRVNDEDSAVMMSAGGQTIRVPCKDFRVMGRNTQGVRVASLKDSDSIVALQRLGAFEPEEVEEEE